MFFLLHNGTKKSPNDILPHSGTLRPESSWGALLQLCLAPAPGPLQEKAYNEHQKSRFLSGNSGLLSRTDGKKTVTLVQKLKETRVKIRHKLSTRNPDEYLPVEQSWVQSRDMRVLINPF